MPYILDIDTGGTYTDAAIAALSGVELAQVRLVGLSTTLARQLD